MFRLSTLRGRLILGMLAILLLAIGLSSAIDALGGLSRPGCQSDEPYQDGLVLAGFALPALALIYIVISWSLRPLALMSRQASLVGPANPSARLSQAGVPAEITPLVGAVNGALDRMAEAFAAERRFTENAAHELRTPLTVLSLRLQRARDSAAPDWNSIDGDVAQLTRLVSQMLDLAKKENAGRLATGRTLPTINLSRLAREAASMVLPVVEAQGRALVISAPETLAVGAEADDLRDAIVNLLENAALHGRGTIGISCRVETGRAVLCVSDEGAGIPAAQADAVFQRFYKGAESHGTGLGLAIVYEVVRAHGGEVVVLAGAPCRIEMRLPAA
jgi:two-component system sensor histidine kinase QseC